MVTVFASPPTNNITSMLATHNAVRVDACCHDMPVGRWCVLELSPPRTGPNDGGGSHSEGARAAPKIKLLYVTPEKLAKGGGLTTALAGLAKRCGGVAVEPSPGDGGLLVSPLSVRHPTEAFGARLHPLAVE